MPYPNFLIPTVCVCVCVCVCMCARTHVWVRVLSVSRVQLFASLAPLSKGFSRQEYWNGLPCPLPGHLPDPGIERTSLKSSILAGGFFTTEPLVEHHPNHRSHQTLVAFSSLLNNLLNMVLDDIQHSDF